MIDDARSRIYAIAIASLGLTLTVLIAGICWVAAQHGELSDTGVHGCALRAATHCLLSVPIEYGSADIPGRLWIALIAFGAVFVATLIVAQLQSRRV